MGTKPITKKRFVYLDFIKVLSIYFVCCYHYNNLPKNFLTEPSISTYFNYLFTGILSTGVPLFFMVNGALMLNKDYYLKKHIKRIINIILLTVIWGIITLLVLAIINNKHYTYVAFNYSLWSWENGSINHLWFLQALVCVYLLFPLIKEAYDKEDKTIFKYITIVVFILTFGNVFLNIIANIIRGVFGINIIEATLGITNITGNEFNFFNNFNVFRGFYAYTIVYFIIGGIILNRINNKVTIKTTHISILFIVGMVSLFAYGIMISRINGAIYDNIWNGYDTVMTLGISIAIFCFAYEFRNKLEKISNTIEVIGSNTIGIYFIHRIVGTLIKPIYVQLPYSYSLAPNLIFGFVVMSLSLVIALIIKKIPLGKYLFSI